MKQGGKLPKYDTGNNGHPGRRKQKVQNAGNIISQRFQMAEEQMNFSAQCL